MYPPNALQAGRPVGPGIMQGPNGQMIDNRLRFRDNTRSRFQKFKSVPFVAGGQFSEYLPRKGYLCEIWANLVGTVTIAGGVSVPSTFGPWNLINRISSKMNIGSITLFDTPGYGCFLVDLGLEDGGNPAGAGIGGAAPHPDAYAFPTAIGVTQPFSLWYRLPISENRYDAFDKGLPNLQAAEVDVTLEGQFGAILDPGTNITAVVATLNMYYYYFDLSDPRYVKQPPLLLVRTETQNVPIIGAGTECLYTVPRMGIVFQDYLTVVINGARSDAVDYFEIKFNKTDSIWKMDRAALRKLNRDQSGSELGVGNYMIDLWRALPFQSAGDFRDSVDAQKTTTLEIITFINANAVLGATNYVQHVRRYLQVPQV